MSEVSRGDACGADGCGTVGDHTRVTGAATGDGPLVLDVVSDTICPWCYVGKRRVERAAATLRAEGVRVALRWRPFELNPEMPQEGMDRRAYRSRKFGNWARSLELDRQVAEAAAVDGIAFRHDLMTRTPNTFASHRLVWLAGRAGVQNDVVEALFRAYFVEGRDVGRADVLAEIGDSCGIGKERVHTLLAGDEGAREVREEEAAARRLGIRGVPTVFVGGEPLFSGAQPPGRIAELLRRVSSDAAAARGGSDAKA